MIDVSNFEEQVLAASHEKPVLVDFWAPWCGPCRQLGPILEKLDEEDNRFTLAKLNTDEDQTTAMRYNVRSIPAVKLASPGTCAGSCVLPAPRITSEALTTGSSGWRTYSTFIPLARVRCTGTGGFTAGAGPSCGGVVG